MHAVLARLGDLGEDASDELEDIESLSVGMFSEKLVLRSFTFIEERSFPGSPVDAGQRNGASQEVTREPFDALDVGGPDGGRSVDRESGVSKRSEELDTLLGEESFGLEQVKDFVSEELLSGMGIEVSNGSPMSFLIPNSSGGKRVDVRMRIQDTAKGLGHGHDSGPCVVVPHGFSHQLPCRSRSRALSAARLCPHSRLSNALLALGVEIKDLFDGDIRAGFVS